METLRKQLQRYLIRKRGTFLSDEEADHLIRLVIEYTGSDAIREPGGEKGAPNGVLFDEDPPF